MLAVRDLDASVDFYVNKLGMAEELRLDDWSFLRRDEFRIRLGHCPNDEPIQEYYNSSLYAQVIVEYAASYYAEFVEEGVEVWRPIEDTDWGYREFAIITIDRHRIMFAEDFEGAV